MLTVLQCQNAVMLKRNVMINANVYHTQQIHEYALLTVKIECHTLLFNNE